MKLLLLYLWVQILQVHSCTFLVLSSIADHLVEDALFKHILNN